MEKKKIPSKVKHSKYKNTGILFELLTRQITADILENKESKAISLLQKYFVKTELGKEYKLYEYLIKNKNLSEGKSSIILNTLLENSKQLNKGKLAKQKYNLIKEIKEQYHIDEFFKSKVSNYRIFASLYNLLEIYNGDGNTNNPDQIIKNKTTLLEYLTSSKCNLTEEAEEIEEFKQQDKGTRILTYKILLEKFNEKYSNLNKEQKLVLKEFINSVDNEIKLKDFYNEKIVEIKQQLNEVKVDDKVTDIKLNEVKKFLVKTNKVKENDLYNLLMYYELINELKNEKITA